MRRFLPFRNVLSDSNSEDEECSEYDDSNSERNDNDNEQSKEEEIQIKKETSKVFKKLSSVKVRNSVKFKMPKQILRNPKYSLFKEKLCKNLMIYLFEFLSFEDIKRISSLNVYLHNTFSSKYSNWTELLKDISEKYFFVFDEKEDIQDDSIQTTIQSQRLFSQSYIFKNRNFISLSQYGVCYYVSSYSYKWAWKDDPEYWEEKQYTNSLNNLPTPHLISVCFVNTHFQFENVFPGLYKLFLREKCYSIPKNCLTLDVFINDDKKYSVSYPKTNGDETNETNDVLDKRFICYCLIKEENGKNKGVEVKIEFRHKDLWWKRGWSIDGAELIPVGCEEGK